MLQSYRKQIAKLVQARRGRIVDSPGDNLLAEFPSATDAAPCAISIQQTIARRNADLSPERRMLFRIGVHLGEVMVTSQREEPLARGV